MKIVTNDYGCGTSSSILDYEVEDVVIVSENSHEHVWDVNDDLLFIGHDFLLYLWDNPEKVERWKAYSHSTAVWCFERIDAIFENWYQKSHFSLHNLRYFVDEIYACDENDCTKYGYKWLPQWASKNFFDNRKAPIELTQILFSGQAGKPEYSLRNDLLNKIFEDEKLKHYFTMTNFSRTFDWTDYINNFVKYTGILNPVGTFCGLNVRAYESLYSGRFLYQQMHEDYPRHQQLLSDSSGILFFKTFEELKSVILNNKQELPSDNEICRVYENNNLFARMKSIGYEIK